MTHLTVLDAVGFSGLASFIGLTRWSHPLQITLLESRIWYISLLIIHLKLLTWIYSLVSLTWRLTHFWVYLLESRTCIVFKCFQKDSSSYMLLYSRIICWNLYTYDSLRFIILSVCLCVRLSKCFPWMNETHMRRHLLLSAPTSNRCHVLSQVSLKTMGLDRLRVSCHCWDTCRPRGYSLCKRVGVLVGKPLSIPYKIPHLRILLPNKIPQWFQNTL